MCDAAVPVAADVPPTVCRVQGSVVVHLARTAATGPARQALCGGTVVAGRPERLLVRSPCPPCIREADEQGMRTVRDVTSVWVNLSRLAVWLRTAV